MGMAGGKKEIEKNKGGGESKKRTLLLISFSPQRRQTKSGNGFQKTIRTRIFPAGGSDLPAEITEWKGWIS